jgi:hypothetical protein
MEVNNDQHAGSPPAATSPLRPWDSHTNSMTIQAGQMKGNKDIKGKKAFSRDPMPGHEYMTIGRAAEIIDGIEHLADAYGYSTADRGKVTDLIGRILLGWSMEFRLRRGEYLRTAGTQDTQSPNP